MIKRNQFQLKWTKTITNKFTFAQFHHWIRRQLLQLISFCSSYENCRQIWMNGLHTRSWTISIKRETRKKIKLFAPPLFVNKRKYFCDIKIFFLLIFSFSFRYKNYFLFCLSLKHSKNDFFTIKNILFSELARPTERALRHFNPFCPKSNKVLRNRNERRKNCIIVV